MSIGGVVVAVADDDVDNGIVRLLSPFFDGTIFTQPHISLATWFVNVGGSGTPNDELVLQIYNGTTTVTMETITTSNPSWTLKDYRLSDYITPSSTMRFIVQTSDLQGSGHIVDAGIEGHYLNATGMFYDSIG